MNKFFTWCLFVGAAALAAGENVPDLSSYKRSEAKIVFDESFNSDTSRWQKPKEKSFTVQGHVGETGSHALVAESVGKTNLGSWKIPVRITPGMAYRISFHYRLTGLKTKENSRRIHLIVCSLMMTDKDTGAKLRAIHIWVPAADTGNELRFHSANVIVPKNANPDAVFAVHVDWWHNGTFIYDNFSIASQEIPAELQLVHPGRMTMDAEGKISVKYRSLGRKTPAGAETVISVNGIKKLAKFDKEVFSASFGRLPGKKVKVNAVLFDRFARKIIAEHDWELNNVPAVPVSYVDEHHRLILNGKPFMPLGSYTMMPMNDEHFARIRAAGFNMIQVQPMHTRLKRRKAGENTSENLLSYIEHVSKFGFKAFMFLQLMTPEKEFIRRRLERAFNGKTETEEIVREIGRTLRGNPNVAGYYLADENIARELPNTQILRQRINFADPTHVTTTLTNTTDILDQYIQTGDILLYDCYPYNHQQAPGKKGDLVAADRALARIAGLDMPFWLVPQGFDWSRHPRRQMYGKTAEEKRRHRSPSAEELTALPLLGAIYGAKGFAFYSYHEIFHQGEIVQPGFSKIFWPRVVGAVQTLKRLEPFIMSTEKAEQRPLDTTAGALRSRIFTADGKTAVVIVAIKDELNRGSGVLPAGKRFVSLHGRSKIEGGKFFFSSPGVDYDILMEQ